MDLKDRITADMKDAMRAKAAARLSTIRLLLAAIKQREVDERKAMTDADVVAVIDRMVKQRKDSIAQFDAGNRPDLADAERAEHSRSSKATCRNGCRTSKSTPPSTRRLPPRAPRAPPGPR